MGASREGFDLFNKYGRRAFWRELKRGRIQSLMWVDTFGRFRCLLIGHDLYDANAGGCPPEFACRKCHKYIDKE